MKNRKETTENIALNRLRLCVCTAVLALFSGCTSPKSPEVRGRVLDAQSKVPIAGAKVFFYDHPSTSTKTDARGSFYFKARQNFHLLRLPPGDGAWPRGTYFDKVVVTHTNYYLYEFYAFHQEGDIFLKPKP